MAFFQGYMLVFDDAISAPVCGIIALNPNARKGMGSRMGML